MLLRFQIGKEQYHAAQKSAKANNGNDKERKAMHQQNVDRHQKNTAPNCNFDGLADAVELYQIGGEGKRPYNVQRKNDKDAPKGALDAKIDDERRCGYRKKRPTNDREHSFSVAGTFCDFWIGIFNVHGTHSLPLQPRCRRS